jgi:DNA mismatch repair protein PMS2
LLILKERICEFFEPFRGALPSCKTSLPPSIKQEITPSQSSVAYSMSSQDDPLLESGVEHRDKISKTEHKIRDTLQCISKRRAVELWENSREETVSLEDIRSSKRDNTTMQGDDLGRSSIFQSNVGDDAKEVEHEFNAILTKADFARFQILYLLLLIASGQFNLGFIIASLPPAKPGAGAELFIIDQHASDEKTTYERLIESFRPSIQPLIVPVTMKLSIIHELVVEECLELLHSMGFDLRYDSQRLPCNRVQLVSVPQADKLSFNVADVEEIIEKLSHGNRVLGKVYCSKLLRMFASKACRTSVMIGMALTRFRSCKFTASVKMKSIVQGLSLLEQPWNCPHGRPTIRHLASM